MIPDSICPSFVKTIEVDYYFEAVQQFRVEVYDADDPTRLNDLSKHDFVGGYDFTLSKVVAGRNQELEGALTGTVKHGGKVKLGATEKKNDYDKTICTFSLDL